jgi:hypothetical protein
MHTKTLATVLIALLSHCSSLGPIQIFANTGGKLSSGEFRALMRRLEKAWNSNDAKQAVECFTEDAVYSSPPNPRIRRGRTALFEFFGGLKGRPRAMRMEWHHLLFDEEKQIGVGEYTFSYDVQTHGMVIVRILNGRIANWREYEQESSMSWEDFVGPNRF